MGFVTATRRCGRGRSGADEEAAGGAVFAAVGEEGRWDCVLRVACAERVVGG